MSNKTIKLYTDKSLSKAYLINLNDIRSKRRGRLKKRKKSGEKILDISRNEKAARDWLRNRMMQDTLRYVPVRSGALKSSGKLQGDTLVFDVPYANYQYEGISRNGNPMHYKAPAESHWYEAAKRDHEQEWIDGVIEILRR